MTQPFSWTEAPAGPALVCAALEPFARHLFTTRPWALGSRTADVTDEQRWAEVARAVGSSSGVVRLQQVHGADVVVAGRATAGQPAADIVMTGEPGVAIAVQAADCVPLLIADRAREAVAAAHAGWRGLAQRVPAVCVERMMREFGSRPEDLVVAAGPSIGACCYEVGSDVREAFSQAGFRSGQIDRWFSSRPARSVENRSILRGKPRPRHWVFDGWSCVREQFVSAGVPEAQLFLPGLCTASHPALLPSYRRDGTPAGRVAGVIMRPAPRP